MQITQASDYGIRAMVYLARMYGQEDRVKAEDIAEREAIPMRFLLKLMGPLIKADLVKSYRGNSGGYALNHSPQDINLRMIIEAIDGPIYVNRCVEHKELCNRNGTSYCKVHKVMNEVQRNLIENLEKHTLDQLV